MPDLSRILLIGVIALLSIAALFCVIGLGTKGWYLGEIGLFCEGCTAAPKGLSIIAFFLLLGTIATFVLLLIGALKSFLRYIPIGLLFIATIFLLATFTSAVTKGQGYSFDLMVTAHFMAYVALAAAGYIYGQDSVTSGSTTG